MNSITATVLILCLVNAVVGKSLWADEDTVLIPIATELKGKRAINPFMDSIGKRSDSSVIYRIRPYHKRYFDSLAGQSLGKRTTMVVPYMSEE
uniref:Secreted RxLR effector peptide protein n=1 Tax=Steinernema glaseri TaxID=37863 RepID=A0A1I7ZES6_9BILA